MAKPTVTESYIALAVPIWTFALNPLLGVLACLASLVWAVEHWSH